MARASKGARHITVGDVAYRWRASGNDGFIDVVVWPVAAGRMLAACVGYHEQWSAPTALGGSHPMRQLVVTNRIVRRLICVAVRRHGFDPHSSGPPMVLGRVEEQIDLSDAVRANDRWW